MKRIYVILALSSLSLALAACSANVSPGDLPSLTGSGDQRALRSTTGPLAGTMDGQAWAAGNAIAQSTAEGTGYMITIATLGSTITCQNSYSLSPEIIFTVPKRIGSYLYDGTQTFARLVNVIFTKSNGSDNSLGSKSLINITGFMNQELSGNVSALSTVGTTHTYEFAGQFTATICPDRKW